MPHCHCKSPAHRWLPNKVTIEGCYILLDAWAHDLMGTGTSLHVRSTFTGVLMSIGALYLALRVKSRLLLTSDEAPMRRKTPAVEMQSLV